MLRSCWIFILCLYFIGLPLNTFTFGFLCLFYLFPRVTRSVHEMLVGHKRGMTVRTKVLQLTLGKVLYQYFTACLEICFTSYLYWPCSPYFLVISTLLRLKDWDRKERRFIFTLVFYIFPPFWKTLLFRLRNHYLVFFFLNLWFSYIFLPFVIFPILDAPLTFDFF